MRKEYSRVLRDSFAKLIKANVPKFKPAKVKSQYLWPGERDFLWDTKELVHVYVILSPSLKGHDEFTIDIGWSRLGRFPEIGARGSRSPTAERKEFQEMEFACRLSALWSDVDEFWKFYDDRALMSDPMQHILSQAQDITQEQAEATVKPHVEDAIDKLVNYGLPYLDAFVESLEVERKG
jgi:hypothetical protein